MDHTVRPLEKVSSCYSKKYKIKKRVTIIAKTKKQVDGV